jgi:hypothetical protein
MNGIQLGSEWIDEKGEEKEARKQGTVSMAKRA